MVGPSTDHGCANEQLFYAQSTSPSAEIEDGNSSNSTTDCRENTNPSVCHEESDYRQEQFNKYMEDSFYFLDVDQSVQSQPGHSGGFPNPEDYYFQGVDWRAKQPSGDCEGEFPCFQDGDLQRSGPSEAEFFDFNSLINYSP